MEGFETEFKTIARKNGNLKTLNFSNVKEEIKVNKNNSLYNINYAHKTVEYYKNLRKVKIDPITDKIVTDDCCFKFYDQWDPYTGERKGADPYGPLYFDPDTLIKYFYSNRLRKLWVDPIDEATGYYQGYYDDGVGGGEDFLIEGRGHHPEWYLFRLPIIDCYLTTDHKDQVITFGPKLTDEEIMNIEKEAEKNPGNYIKNYGKPRPQLSLLKHYYDEAIKKHSTKEGNTINTIAVEKLKLIHG